MDMDISDNEEVRLAYESLTRRFKELATEGLVRRNDQRLPVSRKDQIVELVVTVCRDWLLKDDHDDPPRARNNIFKLKQKLETEFSVDVGCQYKYFITPQDYGCDLRELLFNRDGTARRGTAALLRMFATLAADVSPKWHILTDIDDTVYPNTAHRTYVAGSDVSWHQKALFPGAVAFYAAFHRAALKRGGPAYSTVLSATPGVLKEHKLRDRQLKALLGPRYGFMQGLDEKRAMTSGISSMASTFATRTLRWAWPAAASTSADIGKPAVVTAQHRSFGDKKFERFQQYTAIFPEYACIFIGDNGQGDVVAGLRMLATNPRCLVCIRCVCQDGARYTSFRLPVVPGVVVTESMSARLVPFRTYLDLARVFVRSRIFTPKDASMVEAATMDALADPANAAFLHLYPLDVPNYKAWLERQRRNVF